MGMAASQARLLAITARIHDVEYQAQSIQNAKVQLSTQSDNVYQDYLEALDASTLTVKDYQGNKVAANFNNLCGKNAVDSGNQYALRTADGRLIVEDEIKEGYDDFMFDVGSNDPYAFALYMMNKECIGNTFTEEVDEAELNVYESNKGDNKTLKALMESMGKVLTDNNVKDYNDLSDEQKEKYDEIEQAFKFQLYKTYAEEIYKEATGGEEDFDQAEFDYFSNIFKQIQAAGGACVSIADYKGNAASNSDWLQNMIKCGKITLEIVNTNSKNGNVTLNTTSPETDTYVDYTTTTTIDKSALAKAEAKYENDLKKIDQKDKRFDMDLSKLETERTALTTEHDSVKKVITDNIERTFGIFS